jgi:hypothetical protein
VKAVIKEAQKRIPKVNDYLEYLDYLRSRSPLKFEQAMRDLQRRDPQAWLKLQKYPQFRPLRDTAVGLRAAERHMGTLTYTARGSFGGGLEHWLENSVKDMMKRDRWGPYAADVLGPKATTLPAPTPPAYSASRLGQYLKAEDGRLAKAAKDAAKDLEVSRAAVRTAKAAAATRVLNPLLDLGLAALDPDNGRNIAAAQQRERIERLSRAGAIDDEQYLEARQLLAQGDHRKLNELLDQWTRSFIRGGR